MDEANGEGQIRVDVQALQTVNGHIKVQIERLQHLIAQLRALNRDRPEP